jgi:SAM-dependent methyltransferase
MARRFSHASVLAIDVIPPLIDWTTAPSNLQFTINNINLGMSRFYDQYDFVHVRCVGAGITDMDRTIVEIQRCLKPGGVMLIMDGDRIVYEGREKPARMKKLPGDPDVGAVSKDGSWLRRMIVGEPDINHLRSFDLTILLGAITIECIQKVGKHVTWMVYPYIAAAN